MKFPMPKQLSLAARFSALTIALILLTSSGVTLFVTRHQRAESRAELLNRAVALAAMMSQNCEYGLYTEDRKTLQQLLDATAADENVAYAAVLAADRRVLATRTKNDSAALPQEVEERKPAAGGAVLFGSLSDPGSGGEFLDVLAPVKTAAAEADPLGLGVEIGQAPEKTESRVIGYVRLGLSTAGISARLNQFILSMLFVTGMIVLAGAGVTLVMTRRISKPINHLVRVAGEIADGKLNHKIGESRTTEIAALATAIGHMSANLADMIGKITGLAGGVARITADITNSPESVLRVVDVQKAAVEEAAQAIAYVNAAIGALTTSAVSLLESAREASSASSQFSAYVSAVAGDAEVFDRTAHEAASSVEEMITSVREIAASIDSLSTTSQQTSAALDRMSAMVQDVRRNADESVNLAERVTSEASDKGKAAVAAAIQGMESVKSSMANVAEGIGILDRRSKEIKRIVTVIDEVADETGLLALNASILAAQAGAEGRAFAVVAEEIKELAERTSQSTKEIAGLIATVQSEAAASVRMAGEGTAAVDQGARLVAEVMTALQSIQESSASATNMARAIQQAAAEETTLIRDLGDAVRSQTRQVDFISRSTGEQASGGKLIMGAIDRVKALSQKVLGATAEQVAGSKRLAAVSENVSLQAGQITSAIESQRKKSEEIVEFTRKIQTTTAELIASAADMNEGITSLSNDAARLTGELKKFTTDADGARLHPSSTAGATPAN